MASPRREVCYARSGNSQLAGRDAFATNRPLFCSAATASDLRSLASVFTQLSSMLKHNASAVVKPQGCRWQIDWCVSSRRNPGKLSGTVKACENRRRHHPFRSRHRDQRVFARSLRQRSAAVQILFAPLLARGVCLPVLDPSQRMAVGARPPMTKITAMAGLEGFLVEQCKVPVYSLSVQCVGDSTDSASIPPLIGILSGSACRVSLSSSSPAPALPP